MTDADEYDSLGDTEPLPSAAQSCDTAQKVLETLPHRSKFSELGKSPVVASIELCRGTGSMLERSHANLAEAVSTEEAEIEDMEKELSMRKKRLRRLEDQQYDTDMLWAETLHHEQLLESRAHHIHDAAKAFAGPGQWVEDEYQRWYDQELENQDTARRNDEEADKDEEAEDDQAEEGEEEHAEEHGTEDGPDDSWEGYDEARESEAWSEGYNSLAEKEATEAGFCSISEYEACLAEGYSTLKEKEDAEVAAGKIDIHYEEISGLPGRVRKRIRRYD